MSKEKTIKHRDESLKCESFFGDYKCHVPITDNKGQTIHVDKCLKKAIETLNNNGFKTVASCCGHGHIHPVITIEGEGMLLHPNQLNLK